MKRFIFSVVCVSVFFVGLGALVDEAGAKFKSDEKALDLVRKARIAIGGDTAINSVQSMRIVGRTTQKVNINGKESIEDGETEIAMQLPDKVTRMSKLGKDSGSGEGYKIVNNWVDVVVVGDGKEQGKFKRIGVGHGEGTGVGVEKKIIIKKDDGTVQELTGADADKWIAEHPGVPGEKHIVIKKADGTTEKIDGPLKDKIVVRGPEGSEKTWTTAEGKTFTIHDRNVAMSRGAEQHTAVKHNEMLRLTLSLLLSAPQGMNVEYTLGGEGNVDGTDCNIVVASFAGRAFRLFLNKSSNLPVAINFTAPRMPEMVRFDMKTDAPGDGAKDFVMFKRNGGGPLETADYQVKFTDYRSVSGMQLPHKWTQTIGGVADESFEITSYEINPANIAEKFHNPKVMVRSKKPDGQ